MFRLIHDLKCPYCQWGQEVCHDEGQGLDRDYFHEMECDNCTKYFVFTTLISYQYESYKADCLNTGVHQWKRSRTYPYQCSRMDCLTCEESRDLTESEWQEFENELGEKIER